MAMKSFKGVIKLYIKGLNYMLKN